MSSVILGGDLIHPSPSVVPLLKSYLLWKHKHLSINERLEVLSTPARNNKQFSCNPGWKTFRICYNRSTSAVIASCPLWKNVGRDVHRYSRLLNTQWGRKLREHLSDDLFSYWSKKWRSRWKVRRPRMKSGKGMSKMTDKGEKKVKDLTESKT